MKFKPVVLSLSLVGLASLGACQVVDQANAENELKDGPKFTAAGELILPEGYHEWVYVGSPLTPNALNGGEAGAFEDIRVNWDASVNATLIERLSLEVKFRLQYDRVPAATENLDTNTVISVIYSLL